MQKRSEKLPLEQVLYESIAEAMGYKNNRMPFLQLAGLLPVEALREIVPLDGPPAQWQEALEAALYGAGGFLDGDPRQGADQESRRYLEQMRRLWEDMPARVREARMTGAHWTFGGTRPVNYPTRRIAALACLYARHLERGLFGHLVRVLRSTQAQKRRRLDAALRRALTDQFTTLQHPYWSRRYVLGGKKLGAPRSLVGEGRARAVVLDVVIPLMLFHARAEGDADLVGRLQRMWNGLPRRAPNTVVRRMCQVMFGEGGQAAAVVNSARRQQGLHQLYNDSCNTPDGCRSCVLYLASRAGKKLMEV